MFVWEVSYASWVSSRAFQPLKSCFWNR